MKVLGDFKVSDFRLALALAFLAGIFIFWNLGRNALIDWDESIYAGVAREMAEGGDWLTLHWNGETFFEKPPVYFWLTAGLYRFFGVSEFTARFWSAVFGVVGVGALYYFGKKLFGRRTGIVSALILATTIHWIFQSRNATLDISAAVLVMAALYSFWRAWEDRQAKYWALFGSLTGLVFMVKGPVAGVPIVVAGVFSYIDIFSYDFVRSRKYLLGSFLLATFCFFLVAVPWHYLMYLRYGDRFVNEYFFYHMLTRAQTGIEQHGQPFFWYLIVVKHWARFWAALFLLSLPLFLRRIWRGVGGGEVRGEALLFLWLVLTFLIFSASVSKIQWYIIPIYPPLALLCGRALVIVGEAVEKFICRLTLAPTPDRFWPVIYLAVLGVGLLGLFLRKEQWYLSDYNRDFADASLMMREVSDPDAVLLVAGAAPGVPIFYSGRKVQTAKTKDVYQAVAWGLRFFAITPTAVLEDIETSYPDSGVETFSAGQNYALYGRR